ncbi:cysK, partial [Symbiodinium sp. KB8]
MARGRRRAGTARVVEILARADRRWLTEEDWMRRALSDSGLQAMFYRFAEALDQHRSRRESSQGGSLLLRGSFQSVVGLVWARQQLSVVLGRLRGYHQPWFLGFWASGPWPLLAPSDPYFLQAEIRLRVMISKLEAERAQEYVPSAFRMMRSDSEANTPMQQRQLLWQALADLLVVHHPGWPSQPPRREAAEPITPVK